MYRVYIGAEMKKSFECRCGHCTTYMKETWHCIPKCFTSSLERAIKLMVEGDVLVEFAYATHDFKGANIIRRVKFEDLETTVL